MKIELRLYNHVANWRAQNRIPFAAPQVCSILRNPANCTAIENSQNNKMITSPDNEEMYENLTDKCPTAKIKIATKRLARYGGVWIRKKIEMGAAIGTKTYIFLVTSNVIEVRATLKCEHILTPNMVFKYEHIANKQLAITQKSYNYLSEREVEIVLEIDGRTDVLTEDIKLQFSAHVFDINNDTTGIRIAKSEKIILNNYSINNEYVKESKLCEAHTPPKVIGKYIIKLAKTDGADWSGWIENWRSRFRKLILTNKYYEIHKNIKLKNNLIMKLTTMLLLLSLLLPITNYAQLGGLGKKIGNKIDRTIDNKIDRTIDKVVDKADRKTDEPVDDVINGNQKTEKEKKGNKGGNKNTNQNTGNNRESEDEGITSNSAKDFVPGKKVIAEDKLTNDAIGDFPVNWNTNSSGEIVTINNSNQRWLKLNENGCFTPDNFTRFPQNFTFEFDIAADKDFSYYSDHLVLTITQLQNRKNDFINWQRFYKGKNGTRIAFHPNKAQARGETIMEIVSNGEQLMSNEKAIKEFNNVNRPTAHVALWRQKNRLRVYINDVKIWDIPRAFDETNYNGIVFSNGGYSGEHNLYIGNLRLAEAGADTRHPLEETGHFESSDILFDVNSPQLKSESNEILDQIGSVLQRNSSMKLKITGHTDSDGDNSKNQTLSEARAVSVKKYLQSNFKIDGSRFITEGKGESQPLNQNANAAEKAKNRRVEFTKL